MDGFIASGNKQQKYNTYEIMPAVPLFCWCHTISGLKTSASVKTSSPLIDHLLMLWPLTCHFIPDRWHSPNCPQYHFRSSFWGFCLSTCRYCVLCPQKSLTSLLLRVLSLLCWLSIFPLLFSHLLTPSSLITFVSQCIFSFFLHHSHPSHCCIMALERNLQCFPIIHFCPQDSLGSFKKNKSGRREGWAAVISSTGSALASFFFPHYNIFIILVWLIQTTCVNIIFIAHLANPISPRDDPCLGFPSHFSMVKLHMFQLAPSLLCLLHPPRGTITRKQCPSASALGQNKLHFHLCWNAEWGTCRAPTAASLLLLPPASCSASIQLGWLCHGHCSWQLRHTGTCSHV